MRHLLLALVLLAPTVAQADPAQDAARLGEDLARQEADRAQVEADRARLEGEAKQQAGAIDRLKAEPAGIARDSRLGRALAQAKERADRLDRLQGDLRGRDEKLAALRQQFVARCDAALQGTLTDEKRAELTRRRDEAQARLDGREGDKQVAIARPAADPLDGADELAEKADLLRDSQDRLAREIDKLGKKIDSVETRRRLRERAGAVDDDLFVEGGSGRRVVHVGPVSPTLGDRGAAQTPAPAAGFGAQNGGGTTGANDANNSGETRVGATLRGVIDSTTLDELRRAEASQDLERQLRTLRKMQGNLRGQAGELQRREAELRRRALSIKPRK